MPLVEAQRFDVGMGWVLLRELARAKGRSQRVTALDSAAGPFVLESRGEHPTLESLGLSPEETTFLGQLVRAMKSAPPGWDDPTCTLSWRQFAAFSYWYATLDEASQEKVRTQLAAGEPSFSFSTNPAVAADKLYDDPRLPLSSTRGQAHGTSVWTWVALGVAAAALIGGVAYVASAPPIRPALANPTSRSRIKILGQTGDVNLFDYDAGVVFQDQYGPHWEWWNWNDENDESPKAIATVYRYPVPDDVWADMSWAKIDDVASTIGADVEELRAASTSSNVMDRVYALEAIISNYGSNVLDQYPLTLTRSELKKRWFML